MSETRPPGEGTIIAISAGAYGVGGVFIGMGVGEMAVIPLLHPDEFEGWKDRNAQERDISEQLSDDEALLSRVEDAPHDAVDYSVLQQRIASQELRLETLENTRIPYDEIYLPTVSASVGAGLLIGAAIGAVRCKLQLRSEDQKRTETETS